MSLWGSRMSAPLDPRVREFTSSLEADKRLAAYDVRGSLAHARMLKRQRILSDDAADRIVAGLEEIAREVGEGRFPWPDDAEDVHSAVEARLREKVGDIAGALHTARSRNDQVALALRLFTLDAIDSVDDALDDLQTALLETAREHVDAVMPGYTHLQRAQPISLAHHLLAHVEAFDRDRARLGEARARAGVSPLGAGALAGTSHPIDPRSIAEELGLLGTFRNSVDAVSDRDFVAEFVFCCALAAVHGSRLAEEIVLWTSSEFAFAQLEDRLATGSSIMPQKKNADAAELVRARGARTIGAVTAILAMLKGLPLAYDRDLQEDRAPLYEALDIAREGGRMLATIVRGLRFDRAAMRRACERGYLTATELADHLVRAGVPFRDAHAVVGRIVRELADRDRPLESLTLDELRRYDTRFKASALDELKVEHALASRSSPGGTAPVRVREALEAAEARRRARAGER
ncbi:MAG: argininosuccinate lyase [Chloroflexi bacterium 13_1_40CM_4_68_4]|nr:MAG: argininosuccinate lyase [Chloroflexi bacterium 13_1_40CM_4_68_4]